MTASLHRLTAGDGYTYLVRQVAAGDSTELGRSSLGDYYLEKGESPGRWHGAGLTGVGLSAGDRVTEAQMLALFGEGLHPNAEAISEAMAGASRKAIDKAVRLGARFYRFDETPNEFVIGVTRRFQEYNKAQGVRRDAPVPADIRARIRSEVGLETYEAMYNRAPLDERELAGHIAKMSRPKNNAVAGFDMTFSPVKSVAALWAVAPREVSEVIAAAHAAAVADTVAWIEREVAFTRRGRDGVRQVDIQGLLTAQFVHRDARSGDPALHTHVAISNKVQGEDGRWSSLDSKALYQSHIPASERYNTTLETELAARLGLEFTPVGGSADRRPVREVVGVSPALIAAWSSRRADIVRRKAVLSSEFQARHGRPPTPREAIELAQQANLDTREAKHEPRALADQRVAWRAQAVEVLGSEAAIDAMVERAVNLGVEPANQLSAERADELAKRVVLNVEAKRAQFRSTHVISEVERVVRGEALAPELVRDAVEHITGRVLGDLALPLTRPDTTPEPAELLRRDGTSVYKRAHSDLFSTAAIVAAEASIVAAARMEGGPAAEAKAVEAQLTQATANRTELNPGQAAMVREIALSGRRVQLVLAPAGSGKTTALGVFTAAWEESGGTVFGLAPSAVAAHELRAATGGRAETIASLTFGMEFVGIPQWAEAVDERSMIVVDEAGMAGTRDLARVVEFALERGASVRLVGDDQQLASIAAGGVLRDIATEVGAVTLSQLMRFDDRAEAAATLAVREGQPSALGFYLDRGRVHVHDESTLATSAFERWRADHAAGRDSLMMAFTVETVSELNALARTARLDGADAGAEVALKSGLAASAGDTIVTRRNDRRLRLTPTDWVKNGDRWAVREVHEDGSLTAQHKATRRVLTLPAEYVSEHVDLGYASTIHGAQGMTVDTSYTVLSGQESRQLLYVAASRGRGANHVFLATGGDGDSHKALTPEHVIPQTAVDRLERILGTDGSQKSATTVLREASAPGVVLARASAIYRDVVGRGCEWWVGAGRLAEFAAAAEAVHEGLSEAPAWETLRAHMAVLEASGVDAVAALQAAADGRELGSAHDPAAVLDWRLDRSGKHSSGVGPLPWLPAVPAALAADERWGECLRARADQVVVAARAVTDLSLATPVEDLPSWSLPLDADRVLVAEVQVWRDVHEALDSDDSRLLPVARDAAEQSYLEGLRAQVGRAELRTPDRFREVIEERQASVLSDPWWPVLARRLEVAHHADLDVRTLLRRQLIRPLPDEFPAAALWFRLVETLAPTAALSGVSTRLRPAWSADLVGALPDGLGARVMRDAEWPSLVAAVEGLRLQGGDPATILEAAAALVGVDRVGSEDGLPVEALTAALAWRVNDLVSHAEDGPLGAHEVVDADDHEVADFLAATAAERDRQSNSGGTGFGVSDADPHPAWDEPHPDPEPVASGTSRARIVELNEAAAEFYSGAYKGSGAARYIVGRFGDDLSCDPSVTVGYAPAGWTALTDHLRGEGVADVELVDAGLSQVSSRGTLIDVFRDRVVFGLRDADGALVGFSGRAAPGADAGTPKYLNTPSTEAFTKGAVLFGLAESREALESGAVVARTEGVLDAIAVSRAGAGRVVGVAPLGTALTAAQADLIAGASKAGLMLEAVDSDVAGRKAAGRDFELLADRGLDVRSLVLVDFGAGGPVSDPAELFARDGGESLARILSAPELAPTLASQLIADVVAAEVTLADGSSRSVLEDGAGARVLVARRVAGIVAALPSDAWAEHVGAAAAMMADRSPGVSAADLEGLLSAEVASSGWEPERPDDRTLVERTQDRLAHIRARWDVRADVVRDRVPAREVAPQQVVVEFEAPERGWEIEL